MITTQTIKAKAVKQWRKITGTLKPSDVINLNHVFRIKGSSDLFVQAAAVSRDNRVIMMNWNSSRKMTTGVANVIGLGSYEVFKVDGSSIKLIEIFDRLHSNFGEVLLDENHLSLSDLCPDYSEAQFKHYHLKQIVNWYNQVIKKTSNKKAIS